MAQVLLKEGDMDAVKFVQGETTRWYMLADSPEVTFADHNIVIANDTYDLANGEVETTFGTQKAIISNILPCKEKNVESKIIKNGRLVIIRDGKMYNALGLSTR